MIAPTNRLILWAVLVTLPAAMLAALLPPLTITAAVLTVLLTAVAAIDAAGARRRVAPLTLLLPDRVRLSKGRQGDLAVEIAAPQVIGGPIRIGLEMPAGVRCLPPVLELAGLRGARKIQAQWPLIAVRLGRYRIARGRLERRSRLGLWTARQWVPAVVELRVYPDLTAGRRDLTALWHNTDPGQLSRRLLGKGREFDHLREYLTGDSYEDIHWKATARHGYPVTKVFQLERIQQIYTVLDASRLSARPPLTDAAGDDRSPANLLEQYLTTALLLALATQRQSDLFGLVTTSASVDTFIRAATGQAHFNRCREALFTLTPQSVAPDFQELFTTIANRIHHRALLVILTSLDDPILSETFLAHVNLLCRRHVVLVCMPRPVGVDPLFSTPVSKVDDIYRRLAGHLAWRQLQEVGRSLERRGAGFCILDNQGMAVPVISRYLDIKQRQLI